MKLGLIGERLPHSYSKEIFEQILRGHTYDLIELEPQDVPGFFERFDYDGVNVTVPYKTAVMPYLDQVSELARRVGAVNTVVRRADGSLYGTNTDYEGLSELIHRGGMDLRGATVLILGTGGTSRTAEAVCRDLGAGEIFRVSRTGRDGALTYREAGAIPVHYLINTTPCGMFPQTGVSPIDPGAFCTEDGQCSLRGVIDVIYNPLETELIRLARRRGIPAVSGLRMLAAQAVAAEEVFSGRAREEAERREKIEEVFRELRRSKDNLVLIGMPGSGKTTVGKRLAERTGRPFFDTDELLAARVGPIPDYLRDRGEAAFREEEAKIVRELCDRARGAVIATGGGAVLREENVRALAENGFLIWLSRSEDTIVPDLGRPLSPNREAWHALLEKREPLYRAAANCTVREFSDPEDACNQILEDYRKW